MPNHRLWTLVAVHAALALAPLVMVLVPLTTNMMPLAWLFFSGQLGQVILLAVWLGFTRGTLRRKVAGSFAAVLYISLWPELTYHFQDNDNDITAFAGEYSTQVGTEFLSLAILGALMRCASRFLGSIQLEESYAGTVLASNNQYSLLTLLLITTVSALLLGLGQHSRTHISEAFPWALHVVMLIALFLNGLTAVWATLDAPLHKLRLAFVFLVALVLGLPLSLATGNWDTELPLWYPVGISLILLPPTAIVVITLLYLRRLGYRLCFEQREES